MSKRLWILASAIVLAVCVAPFAIAAGEGQPVDGGARNPSNNESQSYTRETEIIANTSTYGTRQSNKSDNGGGAIYGCRSGEGGSGKGNEPCIRAVNLAKGYAFEFESKGTQGGKITVTRLGAIRLSGRDTRNREAHTRPFSARPGRIEKLCALLLSVFGDEPDSAVLNPEA